MASSLSSNNFNALSSSSSSSSSVQSISSSKKLTENQMKNAGIMQKALSTLSDLARALNVVSDCTVAFCSTYASKAAIQGDFTCAIGAATVAVVTKAATKTTQAVYNKVKGHLGTQETNNTQQSVNTSMQVDSSSSSSSSSATAAPKVVSVQQPTQPQIYDIAYFNWTDSKRVGENQFLSNFASLNEEEQVQEIKNVADFIQKLRKTTIDTIVKNIKLHDVEHSYQLLTSENILPILAQLQGNRNNPGMGEVSADLRDNVISSLKEKVKSLNLRGNFKQAAEATLAVLEQQVKDLKKPNK